MTEKYYYIYKIINSINNKIYIGKRTSKVPPNKDTQYMGSGKLIKRAISKHGQENFYKVILEECTKDNINEREKFYIKKFHSQDNSIGYNINPGGDGMGDTLEECLTYYNKTTDKEIRLPLSCPAPEGFVKGRRPSSEEHKNKLAKPGCLNGMYGVHRYGSDNPFFGKKHSYETLLSIKLTRGTLLIIKHSLTGEEMLMAKGGVVPENFQIISDFKNSELYMKLSNIRAVKKKIRDLKGYLKRYLKNHNGSVVSSEFKKAHTDHIKKEELILEELMSQLQSMHIKIIDAVKEEKGSHVNHKSFSPELYKTWSTQRKNYWINHPELTTCPYCGKVGRGAGFYRWHMENCRNHPSKSQQNIEKHAAEAKRHSEKVRGKQGTTNGKMCITDGTHNKFIYSNELFKYPGWHKGMTKRN